MTSMEYDNTGPYGAQPMPRFADESEYHPKIQVGQAGNAQRAAAPAPARIQADVHSKHEDDYPIIEPSGQVSRNQEKSPQEIRV